MVDCGHRDFAQYAVGDVGWTRDLKKVSACVDHGRVPFNVYRLPWTVERADRYLTVNSEP
jgi:hypothetical protein